MLRKPGAYSPKLLFPTVCTSQIWCPCVGPAGAWGWDCSYKRTREQQEQCCPFLQDEWPQAGMNWGSRPSAGLGEELCRQVRDRSQQGSVLSTMTTCSGSLWVSPASSFPACRIKLSFSSEFQLCFVLVELCWPHTATLICSNFPSISLRFSPVLWIMKAATWTYLSTCLDWN